MPQVADPTGPRQAYCSTFGQVSVEQSFPQAPQLETSVKFDSQPLPLLVWSQSTQGKEQVPAWQSPLLQFKESTFGPIRATQLLLQLPQVRVSVSDVSHPLPGLLSQSRHPAAQVTMPQVPPVQE